METYRRTQQNKNRSQVADQQKIIAMANFVDARDEGKIPDTKDLDVIAESMREILIGRNCEEAFGFKAKQNVGRPGHEGLTPSDVVAAYVELESRRLGGGRGALAKAMINVQSAFVENLDERSIQRDWEKGRSTVQPLSNNDLKSILKPYIYKDKKSNNFCL